MAWWWRCSSTRHGCTAPSWPTPPPSSAWRAPSRGWPTTSCRWPSWPNSRAANPN
eukprot:gene25035-31444_t